MYVFSIATTHLNEVPRCCSPYRKNAACLARLGPNFTHVKGILEEIFAIISFFPWKIPEQFTEQNCPPKIPTLQYSNLVSMQASPGIGVVRILPGLWQSSIVARVPVHWENVWKEPSNNDLGISNVREIFKMLREIKMAVSFGEIFIWLLYVAILHFQNSTLVCRFPDPV